MTVEEVKTAHNPRHNVNTCYMSAVISSSVNVSVCPEISQPWFNVEIFFSGFNKSKATSFAGRSCYAP